MEFFQENIRLGEVLVQLIAFLIVFFTLKALAWKPLLESLEKRRAKIRTDLEHAEKVKNDVEKLKLDYQQAQNNIEDEARKKLQEAVENGKRIGRELQEQARAEARAVLDKAKEDIRLETAKAKVMLRNEIADITVSAAEHLIKEKMTDARDKEIVMDYIQEVEKLK